MAKGKRKPSSSQRARENIDAAKRLKQMGVLSKQTKLHGGKYVSRGVLKKVREHEWLLKNNYRAIPVPKSFAIEAERQGMVTLKSGSRRLTVVPNTPQEVRRVHKGIVSGVVPIPGGQLYAVRLPYANMRDFIQALDEGELDKMKQPGEEFGFTFFGNMSRDKETKTFRTFGNSSELRKHLARYQFMDWMGDQSMSSRMEETYSNFHLYRTMPGKWNPESFNEAERKRVGLRTQREREYVDQYTRRKSRKRADMSAYELLPLREKEAARKRAERQRLKETDASGYLLQQEGNRKRALASKARKRAAKEQK